MRSCRSERRICIIIRWVKYHDDRNLIFWYAFICILNDNRNPRSVITAEPWSQISRDTETIWASFMNQDMKGKEIIKQIASLLCTETQKRTCEQCFRNNVVWELKQACSHTDSNNSAYECPDAISRSSLSLHGKRSGINILLNICACVQQKVIHYSFMRFRYTHKRLLASDEVLRDVLMLILSSGCLCLWKI